MEFKEFEPRFKSAKTRFKFSAGLNLETFDTILRKLYCELQKTSQIFVKSFKRQNSKSLNILKNL